MKVIKFLLCAVRIPPNCDSGSTSLFGVQHNINCVVKEFHQLLSSSYAGDTGESQQVAAGLEDHPDLLSLLIKCLKLKI
jgi:hypothetical protein